MRTISLALGASLIAAAPAAVFAQPPGLDSPVFAVRPPPPGQPGYLDLIKFIDDGMKHVDPFTGFFVSPVGEICFRTLPHPVPNIYAYYADWCMHPWAVGTITAASNDFTGVAEVRLACRHAAPQCMRRVAGYGDFDRGYRIADGISVQTITQQQERNALLDLIFLMGGAARTPDRIEPVAFSAAAAQ